jgi:acyl-coenzyme A synthetase/AMP-(fatty) acid ligase
VRRAHAVVASGWRCYGYIWFVGRADDVITSAAYRISPFEVESALVVLAPGHQGSDALVAALQ